MLRGYQLRPKPISVTHDLEDPGKEKSHAKFGRNARSAARVQGQQLDCEVQVRVVAGPHLLCMCQEQIGMKQRGGADERHVPPGHVSAAHCRVQGEWMVPLCIRQQRDRVIDASGVPLYQLVLDAIDSPAFVRVHQAAIRAQQPNRIAGRVALSRDVHLRGAR